MMLPIIDLNANDPTALYSLLKFVCSQCERLGISETAVTFDQPLYIKSFEIVKSEKMPIFVRLGAFHQSMSFIGSIGYLMEGIERCVGGNLCDEYSASHNFR